MRTSGGEAPSGATSVTVKFVMSSLASPAACRAHHQRARVHNRQKKYLEDVSAAASGTTTSRKGLRWESSVAPVQ